MNNEIYSPPQAAPENIQINNNELASRLSRLGASILDSIIMIIFILPIMYFTAGFDQFTDPNYQPSILYNIGIAVLGFVVFALINFKPLVENGQTIGKKILGIKIVTLENQLPSLKNHILKRYAVYFLPGQIPMAGQLFSLVNILFIFGAKQQCIHDIVAKTNVVKVN